MISSAAERPGTRILAAAIVLIAASILMGIFAPGYMSQDSVTQLHQARTGDYSDWHPPSMGVLWSVLDRIHPGPALMLALQLLGFSFGALAVLMGAGLRSAGAAVGALTILLYPPHLSNLVIIWKDIQFGTALLLGFGLALYALRTRSVGFGAAAFLLMTYALSVRHNAPPALIPFALLVGHQAAKAPGGPLRPWSQRSPRLMTLMVAAALLGVAILLSQVFTRSVIKGPPMYPVQQILLHDIVAISIANDRSLLPDYLANEVRQGENLRRIYTPDEIVPLFCCGGEPFRLNTCHTPEKLNALRRSWWAAVSHDPLAYLRHRAAVAKSLFAVGRRRVCLPYVDGITENSLGLTYKSNQLQRRFARLFDALSTTFVYRGWFIVVMLGAVFALSVRRLGARHPSTLLSASGLLYALPYFFVATTCDFRMLWWSSVALLTSFILHLAARRSAEA